MTARIYGVLLASFSRHSHQSSFVPLFQQHPRTRIVGVADETDIDPQLEETNRSWAEQLGVPYVTGIDRALEQSGIDIVSIGHEIERRTDLICRAAVAGKHLWIDKFLGASLDECDAAVAAIEQAGVRAIVPSYAYGELVRRAELAVSSGQLGSDLLGVHVDLLFAKGWPRPIPDQLRNIPFLPAGRWKFDDIKRELLTVGAYGVGLIQRLCGTTAEVYAQADAYFFPEHAGHGAEDFATLSLVDDSGRVCTLCAGRSGVASHPAGGVARAWLIGTEANAVIEAKRPSIDAFLRDEIVDADYRPDADDPMQWHSGSPAMSVPISGDTAGLARGLDDLVRALDEDTEPAYTARHARDNMQTLLAGYRSVADRAPIAVDPSAAL
jgi:predicted dehydrogenase